MTEQAFFVTLYVLCVKFVYVCCTEIDACSTGRTPIIVKGKGRDACSWVS